MVAISFQMVKIRPLNFGIYGKCPLIHLGMLTSMLCLVYLRGMNVATALLLYLNIETFFWLLLRGDTHHDFPKQFVICSTGMGTVLLFNSANMGEIQDVLKSYQGIMLISVYYFQCLTIKY